MSARKEWKVRRRALRSVCRASGSSDRRSYARPQRGVARGSDDVLVIPHEAARDHFLFCLQEIDHGGEEGAHPRAVRDVLLLGDVFLVLDREEEALPQLNLDLKCMPQMRRHRLTEVLLEYVCLLNRCADAWLDDARHEVPVRAGLLDRALSRFQARLSPPL